MFFPTLFAVERAQDCCGGALSRHAALVDERGGTAKFSPSIKDSLSSAGIYLALIFFGLAFLAGGCASTSVGVGAGVGLGEGGTPVPGSETGLAENETGDFIESHAPSDTPPGPASVRNTHVLKTAFSQVGKPYRYGGVKPETGFDCSGFVNWVYGQYNIKLPRRSGDMIAVGSAVAKNELRPGDLVFFGKRKNITHVGIYTGDNKYIHSPRSGKGIQESSLDDRGRGEYYVGARRVLKNTGSSQISDSQKMAWVEQAGRSMALAKASAPGASKNNNQGAATRAVEPAAVQAAPVQSAAVVKKHKVAAGDTFHKLARKYDIEPALLAKVNKIGNYRTAVLKPGQILFVPGKEKEADRTPKPAVITAAVEDRPAVQEPLRQAELENHKVSPPPAPVSNQSRRHKIENGDTFYAVAKKYGVKAADLAKANNIEDINSAVLRPGKTLAIPAQGETRQAVAAAAKPAAEQADKALAADSTRNRRHTIENGDTFYGVAHKYGVKAADLARANNIDDINTAILRPGKALIIPSSGSSGSAQAKSRASSARRHKVESGDTFYGVAKKYGIKSSDLARANNIKDIKTAVLRPGQTLVVPPSAN